MAAAEEEEEDGKEGADREEDADNDAGDCAATEVGGGGSVRAYGAGCPEGGVAGFAWWDEEVEDAGLSEGGAGGRVDEDELVAFGLVGDAGWPLDGDFPGGYLDVVR